MTHDSSQTNHVKGSQVGSIAKEVKDNAQVSNSQFNQNNNANTTELLELISSMRQTADQFPEGIRDEIIIDIEDIETEIKKPDEPME
jgi:internalin A